MKWLETEITKRGKILDGNILKVNSFLNHQLDPILLDKLTLLWYDHFNKKGINKIVTIEASGIALATLAAVRFKTNAVFAKKDKCSNLEDSYSTTVHSYTKNKDQIISIEKSFLNKNDRVLILDDFLATGEAISGLIDLCKQAGATVVGVGVAIEKGFQGGGDKLREEGIDLDSLEIIESMDAKNNTITFRQ